MQSKRKYFKAFVADTEMFDAIKAFLTPSNDHKREPGESLEDFGARIDAYNRFKRDLHARFDAIKLEAQRDDVV